MLPVAVPVTYFCSIGIITPTLSSTPSWKTPSFEVSVPLSIIQCLKCLAPTLANSFSLLKHKPNIFFGLPLSLAIISPDLLLMTKIVC